MEKYRSKICYRTLNPVWNEEVTFAIPESHQKVFVVSKSTTLETYHRNCNVLFLLPVCLFVPRIQRSFYEQLHPTRTYTVSH